jgi:undecaprenyl-phosphate 4-deoxy-4-formamido-L-arabinose transferase
MAGLRLTRGRFVAIMDDDLQHDPKDLPALMTRIAEDYDVVYARFSPKHHRLWKRLGSRLNGRFAEWVIQKPRDIYLSPYKIICREVVDLICDYDGPFPYVDGLILQTTERISQIDVEHRPRHAGQSSYTVLGSARVSLHLLVGFSVRPLRVVTWIGTISALLGLLMAFAVVVFHLTSSDMFPPEAVGWTSLMSALLVIGGIQLFFLGVLGEYSGRTYLKVSRRPQATVRKVLRSDDPSGSG